ncbi:MAG: RnfABCDGE type electron transport complex subunit G [Candidatus Cloacimonetes bacterium]|nr:RnfABCDGE type electron transport complex subunit G [Candidatus Cloacimonadota bacterium]
MMYYLKLGFILLIFCVVATGILAYLNTLTAPIIQDRKTKDEIDTREKLIPDAVFAADSTASGMQYFRARAKEDSTLVLGYTFICSQKGYSSEVKTMVGIDKDFKVLAIKVIDQAETPGLGANCEQESFSNQFKNLAEADLKVDKDGGQVVSLSGATITSRAIASSIQAGIAAIKASMGAEL